MSTMSSRQGLNPQNELRDAIRTRFLQIAGIVATQAVILFGAAGRLDWVMGWVYLGIYVGVVLALSVALLPNDPELIAERGRTSKEAKGWDQVLTLVFGIAGLLVLVVAGLDVRGGWSPTLALALHAAGMAGCAAGFGIFAWAMTANRFFTTQVRIQHERGHRVATGGPYRFVRHPGYAGQILYTIATPLLLGSLWAFVPCLLVLGLVILRTTLEDRTLQAELPGYREFAERVRFRLVPGVW